MQDLETKSLWSQISGECIQGEMEGTKLKQVPFSHTTFDAFKNKYPNGKLLRKPANSPSGSSYNFYSADKDRLGIFGRVDNFERLAGKDKVYGIRLGDREIAISKKYLEQKGYAIVEHNNRHVYVKYEKSTESVSARLYPEDIKLIPDGKLVKIFIRGPSPMGGTVDEIISGEALPIISAYWFAWVSFFPETELIK